MAYKKSNPNGQATMANSEPVVLASDQAAIPVTLSGVSTAAKQDTGNTSLATLAGAVAGTEVQVDVLTMPTVTVQATDLDVRPLVNTDVVTAELSATDNAVLDAIAASVAAIDTDTSTIIGHVDGIEALIGTTNTTLTTIDGRVDGIEALLTTIDGRVDGLETSNSAIQTAVELIDDAIKADDAAFTPATTKVMMAGFEFDDAATDSVDEGDAGAARMSANRNIYTQIRDAAGNERGANVNASNQLTVVEANSATALTALQLIDDVVYTDDTSTHATGTTKGVGIMAAAVPTDTAITANDIGMVAMTLDRKLHVAVMDALPAGSAAIGKLAANSGVDIGDVTLTANDGVDIGNVDVASVVPGTGATNLGKAEDSGHTSADVGIFNLAVRVDTPNVALTNTDADYSPMTTNKLGSLRTAIPEDDLATAATKHVKKYYTNSGAVTDGIIWSPAAGTRFFVTDIFIQVSAAATVTLEDDLAGGDVVLWKAELAANSGWSHSFNTPLYSGEDAADLIITTSAGNVYVTVTGYEI